MKISIITVCFNAKDTIEDTLKSVLSQNYTNYEYLIIDGKSTDNTLEIVKLYENKFKGKMKIISEKDNGLYDAMNKGIINATGDIIGMINADDILAHKNVFNEIVECFENYNCDGVYSNLIMLDKDLEKHIRKFISKKGNYKLGWYPPHPTLYLKKEVYEKYGYFNQEYRITADYDFMLRIMKNNVKLKYVNDNFVYMRSGGASTNGLKGYIKSFKESIKVLKKNNIRFPYYVNTIRVFRIIIQRIKMLFSKKTCNIHQNIY